MNKVYKKNTGKKERNKATKKQRKKKKWEKIDKT